MTSEHARLGKEFKEEQEKIKQLPVLNQLLTQMSLQNDAEEPCSEKPDQSLPQKGQTDTGMTQASSPGPNQKPCQSGKKLSNQMHEPVSGSTNRSPNSNKNTEQSKSTKKLAKYKRKWDWVKSVRFRHRFAGIVFFWGGGKKD